MLYGRFCGLRVRALNWRLFALAISISISMSMFMSTSILASPSSSYAHLDRAHAALKVHRYKQAVAILSSKAKGGCPYAQTMLGHMYATGVGATKNFEKAAHWFEKAADQGYGQAQLALGKLYLGGERVVREEERVGGVELAKAVFWLRKAAAQGIDEAHELLAKIPGEQTAEYKVVQTRAKAAEAANQAESAVVTGWKGYADMTNTLNQASQQTAQ